MSCFLSFNNGATVENRGVRFPFADSSPRTAIKSLKLCFASGLTFDLATSAQDRPDVLGKKVGARLFGGVSCAGGESGGGTGSVGSDIFVGRDAAGKDTFGSDAIGSDVAGSGEGVSLAAVHIKSGMRVVKKCLPRDRFSSMVTYDILGRILGREENRGPRADLTLAGPRGRFDRTQRPRVLKVLDTRLY